LIVLNIDDYHNIHTIRQPDTTTTTNALHFITILLKSSAKVSAIPFINTNQLTIQNPKGMDFNNIISHLDLRYMKDLSITYQEQKKIFYEFIWIV
jgi:hypothetical protein